MQQVLFEIPGTSIRIYGFGLMLFLAFLAGMSLSARRARRSGLDPEIIYDLAFWMIVGGLVGARAFYVIQHHETIESGWDVFKIWEGGIVLYGSLLGGTAGFLLYRWRRRFPIRPVLDAAAPALALGVGIGRIGCFLNGCCYGDACDPGLIPWAVTFPAETLPWFDQVRQGLIGPSSARTAYVHPTQLYSAIGALIIAAMLLAYSPLKRRDGEVMALLAVTYPINRFLIEQLRDDEGAIFAGLTISQNGSVVVLLIGVASWIYLARLPRGRRADADARGRARPVATSEDRT